MCEKCRELSRDARRSASGEQLTGLSVTADTAVLQLGEAEGSHVDVEETGLRLLREDGRVHLVEIGGSGGRVIPRATADQAR